ncbi:tetratricopeptide repeat protein 23 [Labrus mixtus]|uniref:tetratricopeptide repeat protein 23 n=1 Tax=Labrus mixtus TaxID=508554 RepID=UPI0029C0F17B|nr:tetratricopeptide repeat protein 23 [Labrus mixtus]
MADDEAVTKPNPDSSSESPDLESTNSSVDASRPCASQTGYARRDFIMMPPEEKLRHFEGRAQNHEENQEFDACIQDLVRCVALTRLVFGEGHLKLAQVHVRLAKAYFQFKGWGLQAKEHLALARELLPFCSSISSCEVEKLEALLCLLSVHLTQGGSALLTDKYPFNEYVLHNLTEINIKAINNMNKPLTPLTLEEAESSFLEAEQVLEELHQLGDINQEEKIKTELEICNGLFRVYKRQNRPEEALHQCEKALHLLTDCGKPEKMCSVYRDMAAIEQDKGHVDQAIEHLTKAHAIAVSHSPEEVEGAHISHSLALIFSAATEPHHNDSAGRYFEQSLCAYKKSVGPQDPAFLAVQDDFCRFLLFSGQQERCVEIQKASLPSKRSTFGELSAEVAETLQLIGSVEMTEGRMKQAHRTMTKCLEILSLLYGHQHKKTKATQKAVDMLARAPEVVAERHQRKGRRKTKPQTSSVVPSSGDDGNSMSDS